MIKFIFLVLAIVYGFTCFGRLFRGQEVHMGQILLMAVGIAGFVLL